MDGRTTSAKISKAAAKSGDGIGSIQFRKHISTISEFRAFLTENYDEIITSSQGYSISWIEFLKIPEVRDRQFRNFKGEAITPSTASHIWRKVRRDMAARSQLRKSGR